MLNAQGWMAAVARMYVCMRTDGGHLPRLVRCEQLAVIDASRAAAAAARKKNRDADARSQSTGPWLPWASVLSQSQRNRLRRGALEGFWKCLIEGCSVPLDVVVGARIAEPLPVAAAPRPPTVLLRTYHSTCPAPRTGLAFDIPSLPPSQCQSQCQCQCRCCSPGYSLLRLSLRPPYSS